MAEFKKVEAWLKRKDGTMGYRQINLDKGIDHAKEYSELGLMLCDTIVFHKENVYSQSASDQLITQRVWPHPSMTE